MVKVKPHVPQRPRKLRGSRRRRPCPPPAVPAAARRRGPRIRGGVIFVGDEFGTAVSFLYRLESRPESLSKGALTRKSKGRECKVQSNVALGHTWCFSKNSVFKPGKCPEG